MHRWRREVHQQVRRAAVRELQHAELRRRTAVRTRLENGLCSETGFPYVSDEGSMPSCTACSKSDAGITGNDVLDVGDEAGLVEPNNAHPTIMTVAAGNEA